MIVVDPRHPRARVLLAELVRVARLVQVVYLLVQQLLGLVEDVDVGPVGAVRLGVDLVQELAELAEVLEVDVEELPEARPLHLDRDGLAAALQHGAVDLAQARGGERGLVEALERELAQLLLDDGARPGERGHVVLERLEDVRVLLGQHVRPGRQDLAELDEGRSQLQQRVARELGRRRRVARLPRLPRFEHLHRALRQLRPDLDVPSQRGPSPLLLPARLERVSVELVELVLRRRPRRPSH
mmetsp:Transcript_22642/g.70885  ORF Transcript_22642/g.70885 Transcript_22642/m.70885 type:complete len:242 (-) Transcript_22642:330-1055(-)